jgi:hypothetical protein
MMVAVAVVGIEFGLITAVANATGQEPTATDWLVSTAIVSGVNFLSLPLFILVHIYIKCSHIIDVITYKGPLTYKGRVLRKGKT